MASILPIKKILQPDCHRPHVVILGAGASLAAFPTGDKHGRKLPLMRDIVDLLGLDRLFDNANICEDRDDFERLYSNLVATGRHPHLIARVDQVIFDYFAEMELPDEPTLYDHLVLSLRSKDVVATFNWDPFLWQAMARNWTPGTLPAPLFLHGNTAVSYCPNHVPFPVRPRGQSCPCCGNRLQDCKLLYPVTQKSYNSDPFIAANWKILASCLANAYLVTVFGYSSPNSDVEAISMLKAAWGDKYERVQEQIEIIDIKGDEELHARWKPFIHSHHYETSSTFYDSIIGRHPRRSCEAMRSCLIDMDYPDPHPIPIGANWDETRTFFEVLLEDERPK